MNKQGLVVGRKGRSLSAPVLDGGLSEEPLAKGVREVLLWEAWQLHAKLRKQLLVSDPAGVRLVDELVRVFYAVNWVNYAEYPMGEALQVMMSGGRVLGKALTEEEVFEIMGRVV